MNVITYPCWDNSYSTLAKRVSRNFSMKHSRITYILPSWQALHCIILIPHVRRCRVVNRDVPIIANNLNLFQVVSDDIL